MAAQATRPSKSAHYGASDQEPDLDRRPR
jgi:hypothetical protein